MESIHIQSFVAAPPDRIWAALSTRQDVLLHGLPGGAWPEANEPLCASGPPFRLEVAWPHTPAPTRVSLTLHELDGGTRLDLVHQGWGEGAEWEEPLQGHFAGWLFGLAAFGLWVETGKDARPLDPALRARERYFASGEVPATPSAVYRALTDAGVLERWADGALSGAEPLDEVEDAFRRWRLPAGGELVVVLRHTPRGTHCALAEYGVTDRGASARWPAMFEPLARFLA